MTNRQRFFLNGLMLSLVGVAVRGVFLMTINDAGEIKMVSKEKKK